MRYRLILGIIGKVEKPLAAVQYSKNINATVLFEQRFEIRSVFVVTRYCPHNAVIFNEPPKAFVSFVFFERCSVGIYPDMGIITEIFISFSLLR